MVLETDRLKLDRPTLRDVALVGLWQDDTVQQFLGGATNERAARERFAGVLAHRDEHGYGVCVVREGASGETAGLCGLDHPGEGFGEETDLGSRRVLEEIGMRYERDVVMWGARQRLYAATGKEWR